MDKEARSQIVLAESITTRLKREQIKESQRIELNFKNLRSRFEQQQSHLES